MLKSGIKELIQLEKLKSRTRVVFQEIPTVIRKEAKSERKAIWNLNAAYEYNRMKLAENKPRMRHKLHNEFFQVLFLNLKHI